jgi:hypothetical protein
MLAIQINAKALNGIYCDKSKAIDILPFAIDTRQ